MTKSDFSVCISKIVVEHVKSKEIIILFSSIYSIMINRPYMIIYFKTNSLLVYTGIPPLQDKSRIEYNDPSFFDQLDELLDRKKQ